MCSHDEACGTEEAHSKPRHQPVAAALLSPGPRFIVPPPKPHFSGPGASFPVIFSNSHYSHGKKSKLLDLFNQTSKQYPKKRDGYAYYITFIDDLIARAFTFLQLTKEGVASATVLLQNQMNLKNAFPVRKSNPSQSLVWFKLLSPLQCCHIRGSELLSVATGHVLASPVTGSGS